MLWNLGEYQFKSRKYSYADLSPTNYALIAQSFGCFGKKVKKPEELKNAMQQAVDSNKPAIIDVDISLENHMKALRNFKSIYNNFIELKIFIIKHPKRVF